MRRILALFAVLMCNGCVTPLPKEEPTGPLSPEQIRALFKKARPPQAFGLTVYTTERGPLFAGAHRVRPEQVAVLSFAGDKSSRVPLIAVGARGDIRAVALLDTAARENWISLKRAAQFAMTPLAGSAPYEANPAHVYDEISGYAALLPRLTLGSVQVDNSILFIRAAHGSIGPLARWIQSPTPDLVLGVPFMRAFSFTTLDFPGRLAVFASGMPFPGAPEDRLIEKVKLLEVRGALGVEGTIAGEPVTFILDTGGDFQVTMSEPKDPIIRRLSIGDLVLSNVEVTPSLDAGLGEIEYPRIGRGILSKYKVTFDFRNRLVWFERPLEDDGE
ncbi:MAG: hypothetical protein NZ740_07465 [Kiritimatiellae bacterium]|nr:hypothetical protein [Kiritimatiellia bacterium]MDW8458935.1 hypothetical protein [Verrucomicrobiota bacterium]